MIGRIIGAIAGSQVARHVRGVDGTGGALLGLAAPTLLRRLGPVGLVAVAAGGYAYRKYARRRDAQEPGTAQPSGFAEPANTPA